MIVAIALLALANGIPVIAWPELWSILFTNSGEHLPRIIVWELRLPRLVLGLLAGAALALTGVILQDALRYPLAGPELTGVTSGASVVVAAMIIFSLPVDARLFPWLALLGGLGGGGLVLLIARRTRDAVQLALVGAAMSALMNALIVIFISFGRQSGIGLLFFFLLGSLANRTWNHVGLILPWMLVCLPLALLCARILNLLQLGDELAEGLGLPVLAARTVLVLLSAGLTAAIVSACGPVGWIALLAPHAARRLLKTPDARLTLPIAALLGAVLLTAADLLARLAFAPIEMPVGLWTTLIGGPLVLWLLRRPTASRA